MRLEISKLDSKQFIFSIDQTTKLSEYLSSPERSNDTVCYIPDIVNQTVDIFGKTYEDIQKAEHRLKVCLNFRLTSNGIMKTSVLKFV